MQLVLPWRSPSDEAKRSLVVAGRAYDVRVVRHRRARRYLLRVAADGSLRLTVPRGASIGAGLRFVAGQAAWIARERARQQRRGSPWRDGSLVWHRGRQEVLRVTAGVVCCGDERVILPRPDADVRGVVEAHLRSVAARELPARCAELAAAHGLQIARVAVRNQQSRWGSCSPRRVIALNWRLVQMPPAVSDYILLHELMHLRQANHSRRFWREVEAACPTWRDSERWLRRHGREIL